MKKLFIVLAALLPLQVAAQEVIGPSVAINSPTRYGGPVNVALVPGLLSVNGKTLTASVSGVKAGDQITCAPAASGDIQIGLVLNGSPFSHTDGVMTFVFSTPILAGINLTGTMNYRCAWSGR